LEQARPSHWRRFLDYLFPLVAFCGACVFLAILPNAGTLSWLCILIMPLFMLIHFPTDALHRRLDALMELLDDDLKSDIKKEGCDAGHGA
jgi:hypothetical protein